MTEVHAEHVARSLTPRALRTVLTAGAALAMVATVSCASEQATDGPVPSALGEGTAMGAVELRTADPETLQQFYVDAVGLAVLDTDADEGRTVLGIDEQPLIKLVETDAPADNPAEAGLYHSAFLYADEAALAKALMRTAETAPTSFQGSSDHRVSQAFYFSDPEGNGVELYVDRPSDEWQWEDGLVVMGSEALDPNAFISEHLPAGTADSADSATGADSEDDAGSATNKSDTATEPTSTAAAADGEVVMGHVHLRGGDLEAAEAFYVDELGFAVTSRTEGAVFLAADGYHHHLAVNTWSSAGAGERPESRGLGSVSITVTDTAELDALEERLSYGDSPYERDGNLLGTSDPWGTEIIVRVAQ